MTTVNPRFTFPSTRANTVCNMRYCDIASKGNHSYVMMAYDAFESQLVTIGIIKIRYTDTNVYARVWLNLGGEIQGITGSGSGCTASDAVNEALVGMNIQDETNGNNSIIYRYLAHDLANHLGLESPTIVEIA